MNDLKVIINCKNTDCIHNKVPISLHEKELIEECPICHSPISIHFLPPSQKHWLAEIYEDKSFWKEDAEKEYPSLIAYEYNNLRILCRDCQPYGVLLSLKDNFETLLKLEILVSCAWASQNTSEVVIQNAIVQLMTPNLSMGSWMQIAIIIIKELERAGYKLPRSIPLETIKKQFEKFKIVNWRNTKIGHGAMEIAEDKDFISDIKEKISILNNILTSIDAELKDQEFYLIDKESLGQEHNPYILSLTGFQRARMIEKNGKVFFRERTTNTSFCVDPFIVIRKHEKKGNGIYFFENQTFSALTLFLAYAEGIRRNEHVSFFKGLQRQLETGMLNWNAHADDCFLSESEIRQLDIPHMSHDYVRPTHIVEWLKSCLNKHEKGIFLLQMPRGTGKSVFAEKLNCLFRNPEVVCDDVDIRTYHFSRSQSAGSEDIRYAIEWQWKNEYGKHSWERGKSIGDYEKEGKSPSQALCLFLDEVRQYSERTRGRNRILLVLDGIDEIVDDRLWDFIPEEELINRGIYFLLTSRNIEEDLSNDLIRRIQSIKTRDTYVINRTANEHYAFLKDYYKKTQLKKYPDNVFFKLAEMSDNRTLYFGMLCKLVENGINPEDLPKTEKLVEIYLKTLEKCYGERESIRFREILVVLCTFGSIEPLELNTLSAILGEAGITLQLIGIIRDLSPMIKIERGERGNLYSIANSDLASQLAHTIPETEEIIRWLIQLIMSYMKTMKLDKDIGIKNLSYNVVDIALQWLPESLQYLGEDADDIMSTYINEIIRCTNDLKDRLYLLKHVKQFYTYRKNHFGEGHPLTLVCQAELGRVTAEIGQFEDALEIYKDAIDTSQVENGGVDINLYIHKGTVLVSLGRYKEAETLFRTVLDILLNTVGEKNPSTLSAQANLAAVLGYLGKHNEALELKIDNYNKTKEMYGEKSSDTYMAINNLAFTFKDMGKYEDALALFTNAYEGTKENLGSNHSETIAILGNIGDTYFKLGDLEKALDIKQNVYQEKRKMFGDVHQETLTAKMELAEAYGAVNRFNDSLQEYQALYNEFLKLYEDTDERVLYVQKCVARTIAKIGDYDQAIKIMEEICKKYTRIYGETSVDTIKTQNEICALMSEKGFLLPAIQRLKTILTKCNDSRSLEENDVLETRMNLAALYDKIGSSEEALYQYQLVYKARKKKSSDLDPDVLKIQYEIALTHQNALQYKRALPIYQNVYRNQCDVLGVQHPDTIESGKRLAETLLNLGRTSKSLRLYEKLFAEIRNVYGDENPKSLDAQRDIAIALGKIGRKEQSLKLHQEIYESRVRVSGANNQDTLTSLSDIAFTLLDLNHGQEALPLFKEIYEKRCAVFGENNMETLQALRGMSTAYESLGDIEKTNELREEYFRKSIKYMESSPESNQYLSIIQQYKQFLATLEVYKKVTKK